ncbi:TlpA family protein disulfide reductase [Paraburkholderia phymatum]|uniref:TlpA family protein disulfide reductase n=1 Tax=Paraburkholderia phymatum TaxID=148447 RepID=A0ACC6UDL1_9BURK
MNLGKLALPVAPLIFFASVGVALLVSHLVSRAGRGDRARLESRDAPVFGIVLISLTVARLWFVGSYLPAYQSNLWSIVDFRDLGFDVRAGLVTGIALSIVMFVRRPPMRRAIALAVVAGMSCWAIATAAAGNSGEHETLPAVTLLDLDSHMRILSRTNGKPLVVNLWASWCGPCRAEMPMLTAVQRDMPSVDIALVNQGETPQTVRAFLETQQLSADSVLLDPALAWAKASRKRGFPTTLFYGADGTLLAAHLGSFSRATFERAIENLYPAAITASAH